MPDTPQQGELPLEAPPLPEDAPFLPARMVNEYVYCPRLAYLEWVQGEWAESADTVAGAHTHRRVDREDRPLPPADALGEADRPRTRSVTLSSRRLGLVARIDLVESDGESVVPVDYKRGKRPHVAAGAYDPERVQLCVQGLLLEENGYRCTEGVLYFAESRERVRVVFDEELREATRGAIGGLRLVAAGGRIPPPLRDSPKCPRCSLVGICLPDEVNHFHRTGATPRPIAVRRDEALPLYVQANNVRLAKKGETITLTEEDGPTTTARLIDVSQVVLMGNARMTTPCLHELMRREIPVTWHSYGGWFLGHTVGLGHKNVELREAQYRASFTPAVSLAVARSLVAAKVRNSRTMMRRNWRGDEHERELLLKILRRLADRTRHARDADTLLGLEGEAASVYFRAFAKLLRAPAAAPVTASAMGSHGQRATHQPGGETAPVTAAPVSSEAEGRGRARHAGAPATGAGDGIGAVGEGASTTATAQDFPAPLRPDGMGAAGEGAPATAPATASAPAADNTGGATPLPAFRFDRRNRRPPTDPVNALLSFAYSMLTRTFTVTLSAIGFDVYRGFYHRPRYGRPALALDLMEPFRPIVADSTVLQAINNGEVKPDDFLHGGAGTALKSAGRKRFIAAFERRLAQETTHPIFGYRLTMRRLIEVQGRLFGRYLMGEIKEYPHYLPR